MSTLIQTPSANGQKTVSRGGPETPLTAPAHSASLAEVEDDGLEPTHTPITSLSNFGIQTSDIRKLSDEGITTVEALLRMTKRRLGSVKGVSDAKVEKLRDAAYKIARPAGFQTAKDVQAEREVKIVRVSTGCEDLNAMLGGGIESGAITEFAGEFRTGKTQLALTLCVTSFLPRDIGGGEGRAMYIDTEGTFRPERLAPIAARFELDYDFVMENVLYQRALSCDHLDECVRDAAAVLADDAQGPFRVLIVDSIIALYRQEFPGRGELAERQQRIGALMMALKNLAEVFNLSVFITNQVTATPDASAFMADQRKAVGGNIIAHISDWRISVRKGKGEQRIAKLIDSPSMPEGEAIFQISPGGVCQPTD